MKHILSFDETYKMNNVFISKLSTQLVTYILRMTDFS